MNEKDFIFSKSRELKLSGIRNFSSDFLHTTNIRTIDLPEKDLILGKEFFGKFEVSTITGDFVLSFNNIFEAKYTVYAGKNRNSKIKIPVDFESIKAAVENYEKYLDSLLIELKKDYLSRFSIGKNFTSVSSEIFKKLNLIRL